MIEWALKQFIVIFFRDGVSEGEYNTAELEAIKGTLSIALHLMLLNVSNFLFLAVIGTIVGIRDYQILVIVGKGNMFFFFHWSVNITF